MNPCPTAQCEREAFGVWQRLPGQDGIWQSPPAMSSSLESKRNTWSASDVGTKASEARRVQTSIKLVGRPEKRCPQMTQLLETLLNVCIRCRLPHTHMLTSRAEEHPRSLKWLRQRWPVSTVTLEHRSSNYRITTCTITRIVQTLLHTNRTTHPSWAEHMPKVER